jgi:hypothetical protein
MSYIQLENDTKWNHNQNTAICGYHGSVSQELLDYLSDHVSISTNPGPFHLNKSLFLHSLEHCPIATDSVHNVLQ